MEYDIEKVNTLLRGLSARKISIVSRLAGLTPEEIVIMRMKWLEGKSDVQICDEMGYSPSKLTRKRRVGHIKILDALDLYGLADLDNLPVVDIFDYAGLFYKAQDSLVRFFVRHNTNLDAQSKMVKLIEDLAEVE